MHYQMLQVLSQNGKHIESYQHPMQHTLVNCQHHHHHHHQEQYMSQPNVMAPKNHLLKLFHLSFSMFIWSPNSSQIIFHQLPGTKKHRVPASLLPYKNCNKLKQKKSTQLTLPPFFLRVAKNLTIFQPLKIPKQVAQWPQGPELVGIVRSQRTLIRLGGTAHRRRLGGQGVLVDDYPLI